MPTIAKAIATSALAILTCATTVSAFCCGIESETVRHESTRDLHVWAPFSGPFQPRPIVYAIHGTGVDYGRDWDAIAVRLAEQGVLVIAPDYHASDWQIPRWDRVTRELECGYRYALEVAGEYGGSQTEPVVFVGHSIGGTNALAGGLDTTRFVPGGSFDDCFDGAERPDAVVSLGGCFSEHEGVAIPFDPEAYGRGDARIVLVGGSEDETCPAWRSKDAAAAFREAGRDADFIEVEGGDHLGLIGRAMKGNRFVTLREHPPAERVVEIILETIEAARTDG